MNTRNYLGVLALTLFTGCSGGGGGEEIIVQLKSIDTKTCQTVFAVENKTNNRLNKLQFQLDWGAQQNTSYHVIAIEGVSSNQSLGRDNLYVNGDRSVCANLPEPRITRFFACDLQNTPEGTCQKIVKVNKPK